MFSVIFGSFSIEINSGILFLYSNRINVYKSIKPNARLPKRKNYFFLDSVKYFRPLKIHWFGYWSPNSTRNKLNEKHIFQFLGKVITLSWMPWPISYEYNRIKTASTSPPKQPTTIHMKMRTISHRIKFKMYFKCLFIVKIWIRE